MDRISCSIWRAVSDERSRFLVNVLTSDAFCGLSWFPQLLESRGPVPWAESLLSFLSTAFQRKCGHLRGESGKFWVLGQIADQKEFPLPQCRVNKTGKRISPYTSVVFGILSLFSGTLLWKFTYLCSKKRRTQRKATFQVWFYFFFHCLPHSLSYDRLSGLSTHREVIVTELRDSMLWGSE